MGSAAGIAQAAVLLLFCSVGCSAPADAAPDRHLRCAATISAADRLIKTGAVPADPVFLDNGLLALMNHLTAWAVPRGLAEADAFARVAGERDRILAAQPPARVMAAARRCVADG